MGLERTIFTVSEDVGVVELCARVFEPDIVCPIEFPFSVILSTADRTAGMYNYKALMLRTLTHPTVSPMDYSSLSMTLTFAACQTQHCVNVNIENDMVDEPDEIFDYILGPLPAGLDPRITIRPDIGEVFIINDDGKS